jgi:23S rRNA (pseudouridine1915-N3)-methyltransferase
MHITIIQIGKTKHDFFRQAEDEFLKRLQPYCKLEIITLKDSYSSSTSLSEAQINKFKADEALAILKHVPSDSILVTLDETGKQYTSVEFAKKIQQWKDFEGANITFVIGGPFGLSETMKQKTDLLLSFSKFTFTHEAIRTLLLEQIYRSFMILAGKKYHY